MSQITKRALASSLKLLLLQKPLNKITINDIAEKCGVSRMTFYYHFKDVYDLVATAQAMCPPQVSLPSMLSDLSPPSLFLTTSGACGLCTFL